MSSSSSSSSRGRSSRDHRSKDEKDRPSAAENKRRCSISSASIRQRALVLRHLSQSQEERGGAPMSYLMIKRKLISEFGDDIWIRNKEAVVNILRKETIHTDMMRKLLQKKRNSNEGLVGASKMTAASATSDDVAVDSSKISESSTEENVSEETRASRNTRKESALRKMWLTKSYRTHVEKDSGMKLSKDERVFVLTRRTRGAFSPRHHITVSSKAQASSARLGRAPPLARVLILIETKTFVFPKRGEGSLFTFSCSNQNMLFSCLPQNPALSHFQMRLGKAVKWISECGLRESVCDVAVIDTSSTADGDTHEGGASVVERASVWNVAVDRVTGKYFFMSSRSGRKTWISPFVLQTKEWAEHSDRHGQIYFHNRVTNESKWSPPVGFYENAKRASGVAEHALKSCFGVRTCKIRTKVQNKTPPPTTTGSGGGDRRRESKLEATVDAWIESCKSTGTLKTGEVATVVYIRDDRSEATTANSSVAPDDPVTAFETRFQNHRKEFGCLLSDARPQLDSMIVYEIDHSLSYKDYSRQIMQELIRLRMGPAPNHLIRWDLTHGCIFENVPVECKWHRHRHRGTNRAEFEGGRKANATETTKYKLLRFDHLGNGSFGAVCRGLDDEGKFVAVKVYSNEKIAEQNMMDDVTKEIGVMIKLNRRHMMHRLRPPGHRNVLGILGYFNSVGSSSDGGTGHLFVVLEIAEGGSFFKHVNAKFRIRSPFEESEALVFFSDIVEGLSYMHEKRIVHRDLKLENMLLGGESGDVIKICDFGFSTWIRPISSQSLESTTTAAAEEDKTGLRCIFPHADMWNACVKDRDGGRKGGRNTEKRHGGLLHRMLVDLGLQHSGRSFHHLNSRVGSPHYIAPEVLDFKGYDGFKADVWSLGVILYVLVVGEFPFEEGAINSYRRALQRSWKAAHEKLPAAAHKSSNKKTDSSPSAFYRIDATKMSSLSTKCQDLLLRMIDIDPVRRISLNQVCAHPWVRSMGHIRLEGMLKQRRMLFDRKCWCVLGRGEMLCFDSAKKTKILHAFKLGECALVEPKGAKSSGQTWFKLLDTCCQPTKKFTFVAGTVKSRKRWVEALSMEALGDGEQGETRYVDLALGTRRMSVIDQSMETIIDSANELLKRNEIDRSQHQAMVEDAIFSAGTGRPRLSPPAKAKTVLLSPKTTGDLRYTGLV